LTGRTLHPPRDGGLALNAPVRPPAPEWQRFAACRGSDPTLFHGTAAAHRQAQVLCRRCPVSEICLWSAMADHRQISDTGQRRQSTWAWRWAAAVPWKRVGSLPRQAAKRCHSGAGGRTGALRASPPSRGGCKVRPVKAEFSFRELTGGRPG